MNLLLTLALVTSQGAPLTHLAKLDAAETVTVTVTCSFGGHGDEFRPKTRLLVTTAKSGKCRVAATDLAAGGQSKPNLFVSDGTTVSEYIAQSNQFLTRPISSEPSFRPSKILNLDYYSQSRFLGDAFRGFFSPEDKETTFSTRAEKVGGQDATLYTAMAGPPKRKGESKLNSRLWISGSTGLPVRFERFSADGVVTLRIEYSQWQIDRPVTPALFAWTPPKGATAYPDEMLLKVGTIAPDFTAVLPNGKKVRLSEFKGKPVILDFWATWCGPCQKSMPHLEKVYRSVKDQDVQVIALCVWDSKEAYDKWVGEKKSTYSFPTAFDPARNAPYNIASAKYAVMGIPTQYIIDREGKISFVKMGGHEEGNREVEDALAKLGVAVP